MELEIVPLGQLWPDPNNPRKDFGDLDAMAATFESNPVRPFEPVNPPVVVPDGEANGMPAFRIVDGERRWRAMTKAGAVQACAVIVCTMDEANAMAAMVATDDKAPLTEAELSRGVQQMLAVGVAPEEVDKAARLKRGTAARVRKVAREGTEQMSLDHLLAASEFEDEADREEVLAASEKAWEARAESIRRRLRVEAEAASFRRACESLGIPVAEEKPEGEGISYLRSCRSLEGLAGAWSEMPEGAVALIVPAETTWDQTRAEFYGPRAEEPESPFAEAARLFSARVERAREAREAFLAELLMEEEGVLAAMPVLEAARASGENLSSPWTWQIQGWMARHYKNPSTTFVSEGTIVGAFIHMDTANPAWVSVRSGEVLVGYSTEYAEHWIALGEALEKCGWEPTPDELGLRDEIRTTIANRKFEEDDEAADEAEESEEEDE
ncbi:ParB N-terminal domain-containing protein [uncultured Adlercreutzia sp.]|uniref:ParB/RepB/Spo0J family partition protein n=1 Tax=uncultured Adlercreutzia sp. TaxID=875803 RepID=UPI0025D788EC|nr:ParB N-terminal domain-containing protein [uncultured Adlercreutzia sp.]